MATYQFIRIQGFPRGSNRSKKGSTLNSVVSEGRRVPNFSRHVERPDIRITPVDRSFTSVVEYQTWIERRMEATKIPMVVKGDTHYRALRTDAIAIGTVIVSLPTLTTETPKETTDAFKEDALKWVKGYLNAKGLSLDYCVEHYDEKFPHLHFWFTPGDEQLADNVWYLGKHANPKLKERTTLRHQFFEEVGHKYFDKLQKDRDKQIPRERSRYRAAQDRLPPGTPESKAPTQTAPAAEKDSPNKMFGIPVRESSNNVQPSNEVTPKAVEHLPHFQSTVSRLLNIMLEQRSRIGLMSEEEILDMLLARSLIEKDAADKLKRAVLNKKQGDDHHEKTEPPQQEQGQGAKTGLSQSSTLADLARGKKYEPPTF